MATLSQLVAHRERLIDAAYSGVRSVRDSNGEQIDYRSQREIQAALVSVNREIQLAELGLGCSRITYPRTSKGI